MKETFKATATALLLFSPLVYCQYAAGMYEIEVIQPERMKSELIP